MSFALEQSFKKASKFIDFGDNESAKQIYIDILNKYPMNLKASQYLNELNKSTFKSKSNLRNIIFNDIYKSYKDKNFEDALNKAFKIYSNNQTNADLNHLIGLIQLELGNSDNSINYFKKAIEAQPNKMSFNFNLALSLKKSNKFEESIFYFKKVLDLDVNQPYANFNLAHLYEVIGDTDLSVAHYQKSLQKDKSLFESYINLALMFESIDQIENAKKIYEEGIFNNPNNFSLRNNFGKLLNSEKNYKEAITHLEKAYKINSNSSILNFNLAMSYKGLGEFEKAINHYKKTLELNPNYYQAYSHLSSIYHNKNLYFEAVDFIKKGIQLNPEYAEAYNNYGVLLRDLNLMQQSEKALIKAVNIKPNYHTANWNLALTRLSQENYKEGWLGFNSRWLNPNLEQNQCIFTNKKIWNGIDNGRLLVWSEQGIGDQIMFSRFFRNLKTFKGKIFAILNPKLQSIFKASFPYINFVNKLDQESFDFHLPIASLGQVFINSKEDLIKNSKFFLKCKKSNIHKKIKTLQKKNFLIGISWKSVNDSIGENKSMKLSDLKDILDLPNITFVNLQYGHVNDEISSVNKVIKNKIINIEDIDIFNDITQMSALIQKLNLVVTISNSTAHLAGALGKDTILMLSKGKGHLWYWTKGENQKSSWYSSIKIIQQNKINIWDNVLMETKELIESKINN